MYTIFHSTSFWMEKIIRTALTLHRKKFIKNITMKKSFQKPVSYTHLDVYKRQVLTICSWLIKMNVGIIPPPKNIVIKKIILKIFLPTNSFLDSGYADVYKRQNLSTSVCRSASEHTIEVSIFTEVQMDLTGNLSASLQKIRWNDHPEDCL